MYDLKLTSLNKSGGPNVKHTHTHTHSHTKLKTLPYHTHCWGQWRREVYFVCQLFLEAFLAGTPFLYGVFISLYFPRAQPKWVDGHDAMINK